MISGEPVLAIGHEEEGLKVLGLRHEPHRHACDDAEVRLREQPVNGGPDSPPAERAGPRRREPRETRIDAVAGRQHDLEAADVRAVIAHGRVAEPSLERVADDAAIGARAGRVHPEPRTSISEKREELPLCHAGLERDVRQRLVEIQDAVQTAQVEQHPIRHRNPGAVSPVLARAERIDRDSKPVRDSDDALDFVPVARAHDGQRTAVSRKRSSRGSRELGRVLNDVVFSDGVGPGGERVSKRGSLHRSGLLDAPTCVTLRPPRPRRRRGTGSQTLWTRSVADTAAT